MGTDNTTINSNTCKNGMLNTNGITMDLTSEISKRIADKFFQQLKDDQINVIINYIMSDIFNRNYNGEYIGIKVNSDYRGVSEITPYNKDKLTVGQKTRIMVQDALKDIVVKKCEEIISSEEYQKKAYAIANEIVEYATEGYKNDMKKRIYERMVGNIINPSPKFESEHLMTLVSDVVYSRME